MRYVPDLIPEKKRVLKTYFKGDPYSFKAPGTAYLFVNWAGGILFLIAAFRYFTHPLLAVLFALIALILLPPGQRFLEQQFRFQLTKKIKVFGFGILFFCSLPLLAHYTQKDTEVRIKEEKEALQQQVEQQLQDEKTKQRQDSFAFYLNKAEALKEKQNLHEAMKQLRLAALFADRDDQRGLIRRDTLEIKTSQTYEKVKKGQYKAAIPLLSEIINLHPQNDQALYYRALCYSRTSKIRLAVSDCKSAMELGNSDAEKLHEKINPVRKRVSYYTTLCCDGSYSSASGRGACSHHGGVCNWNEPVYETYRKYE